MSHPFITEVELRWSDLDPNFHVRHSVYYDFCAYARIRFLNSLQITPEFMAANNIGPILFREESIFRRELAMGDQVQIHLDLIKARKDFSRWSIQHHIYKAESILAAVVTVDGAWIDTSRRKLTVPPEKVVEVFNHMPRHERFEWIN